VPHRISACGDVAMGGASMRTVRQQRGPMQRGKPLACGDVAMGGYRCVRHGSSEAPRKETIASAEGAEGLMA
jgi:hypothetical protein